MSTVSPIYVGNCAIDEVPGAKLTIKRGVSNTLTRPYEGDVNLLSAFIAANPLVSTTDYEYPFMRLDAIDAVEDGPTAKVTLTFYGIYVVFGSLVSTLQTSGSWEPRSTVLGTSVSADGLWQVNYYAPTLTYRYTTGGMNDTPQYQSASQSPSTITVLDSTPVGPLAAGYVRSGTWVYQVYSICTSFKFQQKGQNYDYEETWAVLIQAPSSGTASNGPYQLPSSSGSTPPTQ